MKEINGKMEFFYQFQEGDGSVSITLPSDASLDEVLDGFETFLLAAGYAFNGHIEINGNFVDSDLVDPNVEKN